MADIFNLGLIDEDDDDLPYVMEDTSTADHDARLKKLKELHGQWSAEIGRLKSSGGSAEEIARHQNKVNNWKTEIDAIERKRQQASSTNDASALSPNKPAEEKKEEPKKEEPKGGQHQAGAPASGGQHQMGAKPASSVPNTGGQQNQQKPQGQQNQGSQQNQQKPQQHPHGHQQDRKSRAVAAVQKAIDTHNKKGAFARWWTKGAVKKKVGQFMDRLDQHGDSINKRISGAESDEKRNRDLAARKKSEAEAHDAHANKAWFGSTVHRAQKKAAEARKAQSAAGDAIRRAGEERNKWRGVQGRHGADREEVRRRLRNARLMDHFDVEMACSLAEALATRKGLDLDEGAMNDLAWKIGGAIAPSTARNRARRLAGEWKQKSKTPISGTGSAVSQQFAARFKARAKSNELLKRATTQFKGRKENSIDHMVKAMGLRKKASQDPWKDRRRKH